MASGSNLQRGFEKYLANPLVRALLRLGIAPKAFALLEMRGRRSGAARVTPVGNGLDGSTFWLVSMHGPSCDYMKNIVANPRIRVKVRRRWYAGTAVLLEEDDSEARRHELDAANGLIGRIDGVAFRAGASHPVTVRIDLES
jgi:deazaflavin-dependent oxidoreductase (nitroreductase family)